MAHEGLSTQATTAPLRPGAGALAQPASKPLGTQEVNGVRWHTPPAVPPLPQPWRELSGDPEDCHWEGQAGSWQGRAACRAGHTAWGEQGQPRGSLLVRPWH